MTEYLTDITAVSSKGQVVLPKAIWDSMQIEAGTRMMVISDGASIILKPIPKPDLSEFQTLMESASKWATEVGMTENDIASAVKAVRSRRHKWEMIRPHSHIHICRDPDDNKFIECALDAQCIYIVSGDQDLLSIRQYKSIRIITVAEFLAEYFLSPGGQTS